MGPDKAKKLGQYLRSRREELGREAVLLVNLSGRGDKDVQTVQKTLQSK